MVWSYIGRIGKVPGQPVENFLAFKDAARGVGDVFLLYSPRPDAPGSVWGKLHGGLAVISQTRHR